GGGLYKADGTITGVPCGPADPAGTLFNIGVTNSGADGTGTITVSAVVLRDCSNLPIAGSPGAPRSILIDRTPPAAVASVASAQVKTGNDADGTTKINVTYVSPGDATVTEVWRHGFGDYPEYDDAGGAAPAAPAYPPSGAGWTLVPGASATSVVDEATARDVYYYVAFAKDACGNVSAVSNLTNGTLNYHPADGSTGLATCVGENLVNTADVSYLGSHYGATLGPASPFACLDVGPTTTATVDGRPTTDNVLDFEDLMMFALNYGTVSGPSMVATAVSDAARDELLFEAPDHVEAAQVI